MTKEAWIVAPMLLQRGRCCGRDRAHDSRTGGKTSGNFFRGPLTLDFPQWIKLIASDRFVGGGLEGSYLEFGQFVWFRSNVTVTGTPVATGKIGRRNPNVKILD